MKIFRLSNESGMQISVADYGARIVSIKYPCAGQLREMLATYSDATSFLEDKFYVGATCGRVSNRISNSSFVLDGQRFNLSKNEGEHCLHGGVDGFSNRHWEVDLETHSKSLVRMRLISLDGDQGFPGNLEVVVEYYLNDSNELEITFSAITDKPTPISLTNHCYFNLGEKDCRNLITRVDSKFALEKDESGIPTGFYSNVENTFLDFQEGRVLQNSEVDHCLIRSNENTLTASLASIENNVLMEFETDYPALQLYTAKYLSGELKPFQGVCLEGQHYPDAVNNPHFPNSILLPEEPFKKYIKFKFASFSKESR